MCPHRRTFHTRRAPDRCPLTPLAADHLVGSPALSSSVGSNFILCTSQRSAYSEATSVGSPALGKLVREFAADLGRADATEQLSAPSLASMPRVHGGFGPTSTSSDAADWEYNVTSISMAASSSISSSASSILTSSTSASNTISVSASTSYSACASSPITSRATDQSHCLPPRPVSDASTPTKFRGRGLASPHGNVARTVHPTGVQVGRLRFARLPKSATEADRAAAVVRPSAFAFACIADAPQERKPENTCKLPSSAEMEDGEVAEAEAAADVARRSGPATAIRNNAAGAVFHRSFTFHPNLKRKLSSSAWDYYYRPARHDLDPDYEGPLTRIGHGGQGSLAWPDRSAMGRALASRRSNRGAPESCGYKSLDKPSAADSREVVLDYGFRRAGKGRARTSEADGRQAKRARVAL